MAQFHPDSQWLSEYAAGTLEDSLALCVSVHLPYCRECQQQVVELTALCAAVFCNQHDDNEISIEAVDTVMAKLEQSQQDAVATSDITDNTILPCTIDNIPAVVKKLIPGGVDQLSWKKLGKRISMIRLADLDPQREIALHRLQPGGSVVNHDHRGREITVVLCGSFRDEYGQYDAGDFLVRDQGETHSPSASVEECICLSVCEGPIKMTGVLGRLLNPLVSYQHRKLS